MIIIMYANMETVSNAGADLFPSFLPDFDFLESALQDGC